MTFGEKPQKKALGWSQEQPAARVSVSALSKWESGAAVPNTGNVLERSRLFGVSTDYLFYDEYEEPSAPFGGQAPGAPSPKKRALPGSSRAAVPWDWALWGC